MTLIAPHIAAFLQERLPLERSASPNTCESYADAFRLLFEYSSGCTNTPPSQLQLEYIDAPLIVNFLNHLETARGNGTGSRNIRLAAIKSFMHYMESGAFWPSQQRKPIPALSDTSRLRKCNPSWTPQTQSTDTAFVIEQCFIFALPLDCGSLS